MEIKNHFGVYGVCLQEGKLLCIEKTRGPYQHRFDLPGGSQELGEGLTETLKREVLEETGYTISRYAHPRMYDVLVQEEGKDFAVHHIMAFYDIVLDFERSQQSSLVDCGRNYCRQCFSFSIEGKGGVTRISRIRTDKLQKLEGKIEGEWNYLKHGRNIWFSMVLNLKLELFIETVIGQRAFMILGIFYI